MANIFGSNPKAQGSNPCGRANQNVKEKNVATIKLKKEVLLNELELPYNAIEDEVIDSSRWSIHHRIIFEYDGKYYKTWYSVGSTEMQDESPWEYDDEVECHEVKKKQVTVEKWVSVDE